jgi:hypothetical protein
MIPIRITCFLGVVLGGLFLPLWLFVILICAYAFLFTPYELIPLAVLIDAEFGDAAQGVWYVYTLATVLVLVCSVYIKPYLRFYR